MDLLFQGVDGERLVFQKLINAWKYNKSMQVTVGEIKQYIYNQIFFIQNKLKEND